MEVGHPENVWASCDDSHAKPQTQILIFLIIVEDLGKRENP
jgi:hypothetical protein